MKKVKYIVLLLLILIASIADAKKKRGSKFDQYTTKRRSECIDAFCVHLPRDFLDNCINECLSKKCFDEIYLHDPLEDGEVDNKRAQKFTTCCRDEFMYCEKDQDKCPEYINLYI